MSAQVPRTEPRNSERLQVQLSSVEQLPATELTFTENVSRRGARVATKSYWLPGSRLLIKSLRGDLWARVVYCRISPTNSYVFGLEFLGRHVKLVMHGMAPERTTWKIVLGIILIVTNIAGVVFLGFTRPDTTYEMGRDFAAWLIYVIGNRCGTSALNQKG